MYNGIDLVYATVIHTLLALAALSFVYINLASFVIVTYHHLGFQRDPKL